MLSRATDREVPRGKSGRVVTMQRWSVVASTADRVRRGRGRSRRPPTRVGACEFEHGLDGATFGDPLR